MVHFSLQATVRAENPSADWGAILFILDSFEAETPYYTLWFSTLGEVEDGGIHTHGGTFQNSGELPVNHPYKIERHGDNIDIYYTDPDTGAWVYYGTRKYTLRDPVYVGIGTWGGVDGAFTTGYFTDVELTLSTPTAEGEIGNTLQGMIYAVNEWDVGYYPVLFHR